MSRHVLVSEAVAVNVLAGITGSASGGLSIALEVMGERYLDLAEAQGISPELLHRIASMASGGMDTLPHNGAVITLLAITGLTHRQSYGDIFAITVLKTVTVFALAFAATALGCTATRSHSHACVRSTRQGLNSSVCPSPIGARSTAKPESSSTGRNRCDFSWYATERPRGRLKTPPARSTSAEPKRCGGWRPGPSGRE